jgi:hypothetical protein
MSSEIRVSVYAIQVMHMTLVYRDTVLARADIQNKTDKGCVLFGTGPLLPDKAHAQDCLSKA